MAVQGIGRDVRERKRLQQQLFQAQKMEAVGQLAGGVAHDFNNLLTAITTSSEFLLADLPSDDPLREDADEIKKASDRAAKLTQQLLAFSRRQVLQTEILDLNDVVVDVEKMLSRLIGEDIELVTALAVDLGAVEADPVQLEQVIVNLAVNSRDAMPGGGTLTIETRNVELGEARDPDGSTSAAGQYVMLEVSDTGHGLDEQTRMWIFEPFYTTKEEGKGTGLGLATVHGIVTQSRGRLSVASEPGRGTTFTICFPRATALAKAIEPAGSDDAESAISGTVLLIEDDEAVRAGVAKILWREGHTVVEAANGRDGLEIGKANVGAIDMLLTDVVMPGMSGPELAKLLTGAHPDLQVLYMSGYADDTIVRHDVLAEDANFIQKPFSQNELARKVRELLAPGPAAPGPAEPRPPATA